MKYTWGFRAQFAREFLNYPADQQDAIRSFTHTFEQYGLRNETFYPGKLRSSWATLVASDPVYSYAKDNDLWHYHLGLPAYKQSQYGYSTSDWLLHFQWVNNGDHIDLVDVCYHQCSDGSFYLPKVGYLDKITVAMPDPSLGQVATVDEASECALAAK